MLVLFPYWLNNLEGLPSDWSADRKVQDAESRDVVMETEREPLWLETWRQVIKDAQKPGTRVWYHPVTLRQISDEDETFCLMLVINDSNSLPGTGIHSLCIHLRESPVCNRIVNHHFAICLSVVTVSNWNKSPNQLKMTPPHTPCHQIDLVSIIHDVNCQWVKLFWNCTCPCTKTCPTLCRVNGDSQQKPGQKLLTCQKSQKKS